MTVHEDVVWEVRTTGDDTNGGGYKSSAGTTDYSQQNAAQLTLTDCSTSGVGVATLTSFTGGFTAAMVGNVICLSSGSNLTTGWYEITAYASSTSVTLDRAPDDGVGGVMFATGKVGGCLGSPGVLSTVQLAKKNRCWVKEGTYTLTTTTDGSNGPLNLSGIHVNRTLRVEGYAVTRGDGGRPVVSAGATTPSYVINMRGSYNNREQALIGFIVDGNNNAVTGIQDSSSYRTGLVANCKVTNCTNGITGQQVMQCHVSDCDYGIRGRVIDECFVENCTVAGFQDNAVTSFANDCIAQNCGSGFTKASYDFHLLNCIADRCTTGYLWTQYAMDLIATDCIASNCSGYGFGQTGSAASQGSHSMNRCAGFNNALGDNQVASFHSRDFKSLSVDPFEASANGNFASVSEDVRGLSGIPTQIETNIIGSVYPSSTSGITKHPLARF